MPKLVFSNTEEKDNTLNDDKAFTVARYRIDKVSENIVVIQTLSLPYRRDSLYDVSEDSAKDNIYIFEVSIWKYI